MHLGLIAALVRDPFVVPLEVGTGKGKAPLVVSFESCLCLFSVCARFCSSVRLMRLAYCEEVVCVQTGWTSEWNVDAVQRIVLTAKRWLRMGKERQWRADLADNDGADQAGLGGVPGIGSACGRDPGQDSASNHAGEPGGMIVALGLPGLRLFLMRKVEIDAEYVGTIKAKANAGGISGRTAEQIGVGYASKETVNRRPVGVVNDDSLAMDQTLQSVP